MAERVAVAVRRRRLYQEVIDDISELVRSGKIVVGDAFPTEKELALRYDVSTTIIREAFRVLEHAGLVQGKQGGKRYLISATPAFGSQLIGVEKSLQQDLLEARRLFETNIIRLAAERCEPGDLPAVQTLLDEASGLVDDNEAFRIKDMQIHLAFAKMTRNAVLIRLQEHINELRAARQPFTMAARDRQSMAREHDAIVDAIRAHDPEAAACALTAHFAIARTVFEVAPEFKSDSSIEASGPRGGGRPM